MDFASAALLIAVIFGVVEFVKNTGLLDKTPPWVTQVVALVVGVGATFLVADTAWAHEQVIGDKALDTLDTSSKLVVGIMAGLGATVLHVAVKAVRNIGQNEGAAPGSR